MNTNGKLFKKQAHISSTRVEIICNLSWNVTSCEVCVAIDCFQQTRSVCDGTRRDLRQTL